MMISRKAWIFGSVSALAFSGLAAVACSSSSTTPIPTTTAKDSGKDAYVGNVDSGTGDDQSDSGGQTGEDTGTGGDDASSAVDAACAPKIHTPIPDGGVYCPFSYNDAIDAGVQYCTPGAQTCCLSPSNDAGISSCEAITSGSAATCSPSNFNVWQCGSPQDCAGQSGGATTCCLTSGPLEADTACAGYSKTKGFDSLTCQTAANCTGSVTVPNPNSDGGTYTDSRFVVCSTSSDCPSGKTCTAVFTTGIGIGICQ